MRAAWLFKPLSPSGYHLSFLPLSVCCFAGSLLPCWNKKRRALNALKQTGVCALPAFICPYVFEFGPTGVCVNVCVCAVRWLSLCKREKKEPLRAKQRCITVLHSFTVTNAHTEVQTQSPPCQRSSPCLDQCVFPRCVCAEVCTAILMSCVGLFSAWK